VLLLGLGVAASASWAQLMVTPFVVRQELGSVNPAVPPSINAVLYVMSALKVNVPEMVTPLVLNVAEGQKLPNGLLAPEPELEHTASAFQVPTTSPPHAVLPVQLALLELELPPQLGSASAPTNQTKPNTARVMDRRSSMAAELSPMCRARQAVAAAA
jgi:hypothetical protein